MWPDRQGQYTSQHVDSVSCLKTKSHALSFEPRLSAPYVRYKGAAPAFPQPCSSVNLYGSQADSTDLHLSIPNTYQLSFLISTARGIYIRVMRMARRYVRVKRRATKADNTNTKVARLNLPHRVSTSARLLCIFTSRCYLTA